MSFSGGRAGTVGAWLCVDLRCALAVGLLPEPELNPITRGLAGAAGEGSAGLAAGREGRRGGRLGEFLVAVEAIALAGGCLRWPVPVELWLVMDCDDWPSDCDDCVEFCETSDEAEFRRTVVAPFGWMDTRRCGSGGGGA